MIWILSCALLLVAFCAAFLLFELRRTRMGYEQIYGLLVKDRDQAREEIVTLRRALFPQLDRVVAPPSSSARPEGGGPRKANQPTSAATPVMTPSRTPFRLRFKQLVAEHNTGQKHIDKIAAATTAQEKQA